MTSMKAFEYQNVTLLPSHFQEQFEQIRRWLLALDSDRLLHGFRARVGLPAPKNTYPGWYGNNGCVFGQLMGSFAKIYMVTKDQELRRRCYNLVDEWAKTISPDGMALFPEGNHSPYTYEKVLGGLLDAYEYARHPTALAHALTITKWADNTFKRNINRNGDQDETLVAQDMIEWYTLPENLVRAYQLSGNEYFLAFAKEWVYPFMWDELAKGKDAIPPRHAYSHVNSLSSAAGMYLATGEKKYLDTIVHGYELITKRHMFVTGGYGPAESLFGKDGYLGDSLLAPETLHEHSQFHPFWGDPPRNDVWGSCEVPCSAWAVFKLCKYLMGITGEAKFGDWAERILVNGTAAQLPIQEDGRVMYYTSYFIDGAYKTLEDRRIGNDGSYNTWQCCTGTTPQDMIEYNNLIYFMQHNALLIAQYLPSKVTQPTSGGEFRVTMNTEYPRAGSIRLTIELSKPMTHALKLRIPNWVKPGEATLSINGEQQKWIALPGDWGVIEREWHNLDEVTVALPFHLRFEAVDAEHPHLMALCYGPLVLVGDEMMKLNGDPSDPEAWIHMACDDTLTFLTDKGTDYRYDFMQHEFHPFYDLGGMKWYFMYNHIQKKES